MLQRAVATAWLVLLGGWLAACQPSPPEDAADEGDSQRVAVIEGEAITQGELDEWIKDELFREQTDDLAAAEVYELRSRSLQDLIDERLLEAEAETARRLDRGAAAPRARGARPDQRRAGDRLLREEPAADGRRHPRPGRGSHPHLSRRTARRRGQGRAAQAREGRGAAGAAAGHGGRRRPLDRSRRRTGHDRGVQRFPVPLLRARERGREADPAALSDAGALRLPPPPAGAHPPGGAGAPPKRRPAPTRRAASGTSTTSSSPTSARSPPPTSSATRRSSSSTRRPSSSA